MGVLSFLIHLWKGVQGIYMLHHLALPSSSILCDVNRFNIDKLSIKVLPMKWLLTGHLRRKPQRYNGCWILNRREVFSSQDMVSLRREHLVVQVDQLGPNQDQSIPVKESNIQRNWLLQKKLLLNWTWHVVFFHNVQCLHSHVKVDWIYQAGCTINWYWLNAYMFVRTFNISCSACLFEDISTYFYLFNANYNNLNAKIGTAVSYLPDFKCLSISLFTTCICISVFACQPVSVCAVSLYLSVYLSVPISLYLSIYLPVSISLCMSVY